MITMSGISTAYFAAKLIGIGIMGIGTTSFLSAFHQYSFKLNNKKGSENSEIELLREKAKSVNQL